MICISQDPVGRLVLKLKKKKRIDLGNQIRAVKELNGFGTEKTSFKYETVITYASSLLVEYFIIIVIA